MNDFEKERLNELWEYPLFEALARRRSLRFPRGCEITDAHAPYVYASTKDPIPLSELETAILCWAAHGVTGTIAGELEASCNCFNSWTGRTHPNPCNDQKQYLMFYNDDGMFLYNPTKATDIVEFKTPEDREKILTQFREGTVQISDQRPDIPSGALMSFNHWKENKPGTTTFVPVNDVTFEYVNLLFCAFQDEHWCLMDNDTGKPAGLQEFVDSGYLNGATAPVSLLENLLVQIIGGTGHYMLQNLGLATAALGLNGHPWGGYVSLILMGGTPLGRGFGFRFATGKDGMPSPVGIDGFVEALVPPYTSKPDEIVDKFIEWKFGIEGMYTTNFDEPQPLQDNSLLEKMERYTPEAEAAVRAYVNYIYDKYGRFPAEIDAIMIPSVFSVTHADLDFFDTYYNKQFINETIKNHMCKWHG